VAEGIATLQAVIEHLEQATAEAREATRETHSAIKALRQAEREARSTAREITDDFGKTMGEQVQRVVDEGLAELREVIRSTCELASDKVDTVFDRHVNLLLYGNEQGRGVSLLDRISAMLHVGEKALRMMTDELPRLPPQPTPTSPTVRPRR
jgi:hypothetical protein